MRSSVRTLNPQGSPALPSAQGPQADAPTAALRAGLVKRLPAASPSPPWLSDLYGDYFDVPSKKTKSVRFAEPLASYAPTPPPSPKLASLASGTDGVAIVHISQKLADPTWLMPSRPAPKPPAAPEQPDAAPSTLPDPIVLIMQREVLRIARLVEDEAEQIARALDTQLQHHVQNSHELGPKLDRALKRLDAVARRTDAQGTVAATLPIVGTALCRHMRALIDTSRTLPPLPLTSIVKYLRAESHEQALKLVVSDVPFSLPMAQDALDACAQDSTHAPTLRALSLVYRGLCAEAATLPPGGDPRLQLNMPNKIYTLEKTPGQLAQLWQAKANTLWMQSHAANARFNGQF